MITQPQATNESGLCFQNLAREQELALSVLATAEKFINDCGYRRGDEELADAKRTILDS